MGPGLLRRDHNIDADGDQTVRAGLENRSGKRSAGLMPDILFGKLDYKLDLALSPAITRPIFSASTFSSHGGIGIDLTRVGPEG